MEQLRFSRKRRPERKAPFSAFGFPGFSPGFLVAVKGKKGEECIYRSIISNFVRYRILQSENYKINFKVTKLQPFTYNTI